MPERVRSRVPASHRRGQCEGRAIVRGAVFRAVRGEERGGVTAEKEAT